MYQENEFYYINPSDLDDRYIPIYEDLFNVSFDIAKNKVVNNFTGSKYNIDKFNTFKHVKLLIDTGKVNHIYEYINMFFMFREQYDVIEHRYLMRDRFNNIIETPVQMCDRVATFIAMAEPHDKIRGVESVSKWYLVFIKKLINMEISPNTPTWTSAGIPGFGSMACTVVGNDDSLDGISKWYRDTTFLNKSGFGVGHSLHKIRPGGAPYGKSKIKTKSSMNWLFPIDDLSRLMSQGISGREGANMVSIPVWHPDILEFISFKTMVPLANGHKENARKMMKEVMNSGLGVKEKEKIVDLIDRAIPLKSFNMSVLVNDKFMCAVEEDDDWVFNFELPDHEHKIKITKKARDIFNLICKNAHETGDPGILFFDRANEDNVIKKEKGNLYCTNPCVSGDTMIVTKSGHYKIKDLIGRDVEIFTGTGWLKVNSFKVTGTNKKLFRLTLYNGQHIDATSYHKFILCDGSKKELKDLNIGDELRTHDLKINGNIHIDGAYLKGFLLGDGNIHGKQPVLWLYEPKYCCEDRLIKSAEEITKGEMNINAIAEISFKHSFGKSDRKRMVGLAPLSHELFDYCTKYRKSLPEGFLNWDFRSKTEFIAGYMDADGTAGDHHGFRYQVSSVSKMLLYDFQLLLQNIGVESHFSLMKHSEEKDFKNRGGVCHTQDSFRLTIGQKGSVLLSRSVNFYRLESFAKRNFKEVKSRGFRVKSIESAGVAEKVYCCVTNETDRMSISNGLQISRCGEQYLHSYSSCNLWTINLLKHFDFYHRKITIGKLRDTINISVRAGDNLITVNSYPREVPEIEKAAKEERRIGIDFTGLADYLYLSRIKYGSKDAEGEISMLYKLLRDVARSYSVKLGGKRGSFPLWRKSGYNPNGADFSRTKKCPRCGRATEIFDNYIQCSNCNWAKFKHIRNMNLLTTSPTGTRSRMLAVSWGIEPHFYKWWESTVMEGKSVPGVNRVLEWYIKMWILREDTPKEYQSFENFCQAVDAGDCYPADLFGNWVESHNLKPEQHLKVQSLVQQWVDNSVSKTLNMSRESTVDNIYNIYMLAWKSRVKGVTVYRDGSHFREVIGKKEKCPECESENMLKIEGCVQCRDCSWAKCSA